MRRAIITSSVIANWYKGVRRVSRSSAMPISKVQILTCAQMNYKQARQLQKGDTVKLRISGDVTAATVDNVSDDTTTKTVYVSVRTPSGTFYSSVPHTKLTD